jgi:hypothetical protein
MGNLSTSDEYNVIKKGEYSYKIKANISDP